VLPLLLPLLLLLCVAVAELPMRAIPPQVTSITLGMEANREWKPTGRSTTKHLPSARLLRLFWPAVDSRTGCCCWCWLACA
jgi:hypothetical protein